MARKPEWRNELTRYIAAIYQMPFDERERHCGYFTGNAILAMTGEDLLLDGLRDSANLSEMLQRVMDKGFSDHVEYVASIFQECAPLEAGPGDIAVLAGDGGWSLGIIQGDYIYAIAENGILLVPITQAERVFKV